MYFSIVLNFINCFTCTVFLLLYLPFVEVIMFFSVILDAIFVMSIACKYMWYCIKMHLCCLNPSTIEL